tara:strand:+ start:129 stop:530 length:402 start_codon:yes stop_codon:yes gene_type:complete
MNYRNAKYINDSGWIDCEIEHPVHGWIPYTLDPADTDMTVNNDDLLAAMTVADDVAAYVPPTQEELDALLAKAERYARNKRLQREVDPVANNVLRWAALAADAQAALGVYRQELLDVPQQAGFPNTHTWPNKP